MHFYALLEAGAGKKYRPDRRVSNFRPADLPIHDQPDFIGYLCGQTVEREGGNEADNAVGDRLRDLGKLDLRGRIFYFGQPIQAPGEDNQGPFIPEPVDDPSVYPQTQCSCFTRANDSAPVADGGNGFFLALSM